MFSAKVLFLLSCAIAMAAATPQIGKKIAGGITPLSGDKLIEAEETLKTSLSKLAAGDGPNYTLSKIISATHQVVSGSLYRYKAELTDGSAIKQCEIKIWSQPWLENGIEVTIDCEGEDQVVKKHSV